MNNLKEIHQRAKKSAFGKGSQKTTSQGRALAAIMNGRGKGYVATLPPEEQNVLKP